MAKRKRKTKGDKVRQVMDLTGAARVAAIRELTHDERRELDRRMVARGY
jgi:hypothetical protein